jgi:hypothetical protein
VVTRDRRVAGHFERRPVITVRQFLSPLVQGRFSLRHNGNRLNIFQAKVSVLSLPGAKVRNPGGGVGSGRSIASLPLLLGAEIGFPGAESASRRDLLPFLIRNRDDIQFERRENALFDPRTRDFAPRAARRTPGKTCGHPTIARAGRGHACGRIAVLMRSRYGPTTARSASMPPPCGPSAALTRT